MADNFTQNGLSIGAFNQAQQGPTASITAPGSRPIDVIRQAQASIQTLGFLQYPSDLPKFYMGFQISKYTRSSLLAIGIETPINQIALPFPDRMLDVNQVAYDKVSFGAAIGSLVNANIKPIQDLAANPTLQNGADQLKNLGTGNVANAIAVDTATALTGEMGRAVAGAAGYSPNYFLTVVLNGPQYKQYSLSWTMAPRNPREAAQLTQIIRVFRDAMAPGLALGGALFSFPRVFRNYYAPNPGHLCQFKPSVLMNFSVDYSAGGMPSMRQLRPETGNWETPTAIKISASFMELEFWLRSDFGDVSPGADPNQATANERIPMPGSGRSAP